MTATNWTPDKIKQLRARLGLTQTEFGVRIGVTQNAVAQYETGKRRPGGSTVVLLDQLSSKRSSKNEN